jgi:sugar phosphate isomerase/epimerase
VIRSAVTVSLVEEARGGPFVFWHDLPDACRQARELGFHAIELFAPSPAAVDAAALKKLLADHGLTLAAVGTGAGWVQQQLHLCLPQKTARTKAIKFVRSMIDLGAEFGAPAIIGSMQGRSGDKLDAEAAMACLTDALNELGEHAAGHGVPLVFEPLNRYETNMVNSIAAGVRLLQSLATSNVVLLADLFHMNIEEDDIAAALRAGKGYIGHLHFVDSNRRPAGLGHLDFEPIAEALADISYQGYASAESLPFPDSAGAAKQTIETFKRLFAS